MQVLAEGFLEHVADAGGAVVEEKIVAVAAVFRAVVPLQEAVERLLHLRGKREGLLNDSPALFRVLIFREGVGIGGKNIIQQPAGELDIESRLLEIKGAVVVDAVELVLGIDDADGAVAEGRVKLPAGGDGEEGNLRLRRELAGQLRLGKNTLPAR